MRCSPLGIGARPVRRSRTVCPGSDWRAWGLGGAGMAVVQGSVGLIGCHLESQQHWYSKKVLQPHWHQNTHHRLLWQFVANHLLQNQQMPLF